MSFFGKIASGVRVAIHLVGAAGQNPLLGAALSAVPFAGAALAVAARVDTAINTIEAAHLAAGLEKTGPQKFDFVEKDFAAGFEVARAIAHSRGKDLVYSADKLKAAVNLSVAAKNAYKELIDSFEERDLT